MPGAVILVGNSQEIVYRKAFGFRQVRPESLLMTEDTIFDLASLTKVVATTTAVMQLVEQGRLRLDDRVSRYWPEFRAKGKGGITVRNLLTHYSGLRADLRLKPAWHGYEAALHKMASEKPIAPAGKVYVYSDINFDVLGELVRRISGRRLDEYCASNIFGPLGMKDTMFRPSPSVLGRVAPTEYTKGRLLRGEVHDPISHAMGGVAGHAGLFSTADDLSVFARMLLSRGTLNGVKILNPESIELMTSPQSPANSPKLRGLGWDIEAPFCSNREDFSAGAYGHLGYTGTSLWIDPVTGMYVIILTNRVYPDGKGDVKELRDGVRTIISAALGPISSDRPFSRQSQ